MDKNRTTEKTTPAAALLLRKDDYFLFSDLDSVLDISEKEARELKGHIMKTFWLKKLTHKLSAFPSHTPHISTNANGIGKTDQERIEIGRETFLSFLNSQEINTFVISNKEWNFYEKLIIEEKNTKKELNKEKFVTIFDERPAKCDWILSYLPNLAVHIEDLIFVLKKIGLAQLLALLPKQKNKRKPTAVKPAGRSRLFNEKRCILSCTETNE